MYAAPKPEHQDFSKWDKRSDPKWLLQTDRLPAELVREVAGVAQASNGTFDHPRSRPSLVLAAQALGYEQAADRALTMAQDLMASGKPESVKRGRAMLNDIAVNAAAYGDTETLSQARDMGAFMGKAYRVAAMASTHENGRASLREIVSPGPHALGYTPTAQDTLFAGMALANVNIIQKGLDNGGTFNDNTIVNAVARLAEATGQRSVENSIADKQAAAVKLIVDHLQQHDKGVLQQIKSVMDTRQTAAVGREILTRAQER